MASKEWETTSLNIDINRKRSAGTGVVKRTTAEGGTGCGCITPKNENMDRKKAEGPKKKGWKAGRRHASKANSTLANNL